MLAYVQLVQRKEKEIGCDVLTHQKWYVFVLRNRWYTLNPCLLLGAARHTLTASCPQCPPAVRVPLQQVSQLANDHDICVQLTVSAGKDSTEHSF
jgi:hypothetical protein